MARVPKTDRAASDSADPDKPSTWERAPGWLLLPPASPPPPPIETRPALLPIADLAWEDFERLCMRLLELEGESVHVRLHGFGRPTPGVTRPYGERGQAQQGIDVYSRDPLGLGQVPDQRPYVALQARRVKRVTKTGLSNAVRDFLGGSWMRVSRKFIYATSLPGVATQFTDEAEGQATRLAAMSIEFEVWDAEAISARLRAHPRLVDDFFGRVWVSRFLGPEATAGLGARLDAHRTAELRRELARVYAASFCVADSGQMALRLSARPAVALHDRFVTPDLLTARTALGETVAEPEAGASVSREAEDSIDHALYRAAAEEGPWSMVAGGSHQTRARGASTDTGRVPADSWFAQSPRQVIVGDPGAGKSTLLRYLVLDLLSESPQWPAVTERWGQRLPVWLPFHFFTQRVAGNTGEPASVGSALRAWLEQHDVANLWPLVEAALEDERLLIVVDGLDEWVDDDAGRYAAAALETFVAAHAAAVVVSTRPYGLAKLTLGAGWSYARVAPLSPGQKRTLAHRYFKIAATGADDPAEGPITRSTDEFIREVQGSPDLLTVSGIPLFFVLLIGLRLANAGKLPERRFEVYDRAAALLIADHPARRRAAAGVTAPRQRLLDRQIRSVLAEAAFASLRRGDIGSIDAADLRRDLVAALRDPDSLGLAAAAANAAADELMDVAEGELGVIVRKGARELGFIHRMLQDQLAAEHAADRLRLEDQTDLIRSRVGDPRWREVFLALIWRTNRPGEVRRLVEAIQDQVNETPSGLQSREVLAEVVFGPFNLPAAEARERASPLLEVIETHPYRAHRARLVDAVLRGIDSVTTGDLVEEALLRWAVRPTRPSPALTWHLAQLPAGKVLADIINRSLVRALSNGDADVAFEAALAIVSRCSDEGQATPPERDALFSHALRVVADPASAAAQAAALSALALGWPTDPAVANVLFQARASADESVRIVALADALDVLDRTLRGGDAAARELERPPLSEDERRWLSRRLVVERGIFDGHRTLRVHAVAEAVRGDQRARAFCIQRLTEGSGPDIDFIWHVACRAFPDDADLAAVVCDSLRAKEHSWLRFGLYRGSDLLGDAYGKGSQHRQAVADAIEDHLRRYDGRHREMELADLARIDHGPHMKNALLRDLRESSFPHWAARTLADEFAHDPEVISALRDALSGDAVRASRIANAAPKILDSDAAIAQLLAILGGVAQAEAPSQARLDIVGLALVQASDAIKDPGRRASIAAEALALLPAEPDDWHGDPSYDLAVAFYPAPAASEALKRLAAEPNHLVMPFLRAYRDDPDAVRPFAEEAASVFRSLPSWHRGRVCQHLANRPGTSQSILRLTQRWHEEVAEENKSTASLAYHSALVEARRDGLVDDALWESARLRLAEEAASYGLDHESRRRAAWVGMCVVEDWSMVDGAVETIGDAVPIGVPIARPLHGPDLVLLRQLAIHWSQLRAHFGGELMKRLSGLRATETSTAWNALALVAADHPSLDAELHDAVAIDPSLLSQEGVLAWFVSRPGTSAELAMNALLEQLPASSNARGLAARLLAEPERIGLDPDLVPNKLEAALGDPSGWGDAALETLASLVPDHPRVVESWERISEIISRPYEPRDEPPDDEERRRSPHPHTYLAVAYASVPTGAIVAQMERDMAWLTDADAIYFEDAFVRHAAKRLRRDAPAADRVRSHILDPATSDETAAVFASLLAAAVPLDPSVLVDLRQRAARQVHVDLAPIVRDPAASSSLSAKNILYRLTDVSGRGV